MIEIVEFEDKFANDLYSIHVKEMPINDQMSKQNFFDEFGLSSRKYFVALSDKKAVGYIGLFDCDNDYNIIGIAIDNSMQNSGIGTKLIEKAISFARYNKKSSLSLEVDEHNTKAIKFYNNMGFIVTNIRKKYYKDSDAYIMFLYL